MKLKLAPQSCKINTVSFIIQQQIMAQYFALYDDLLAQVRATTIQSVELWRICGTIENLTRQLPEEIAQTHTSFIFALIYHHALIANQGMLFSTVPYGGSVLGRLPGPNRATGKEGRGILFKITELPPLLQQVIAKYVMTYMAGS
jgi:hypothetical protein